MDITFYTVAYDDVKNVVELDDLMKSFDEIHLDRGRPVGDDLDQQIPAMMLELCMKYDLHYFSDDDEIFIFYPVGMNEKDVREALETGGYNDSEMP